MSIKTLVINPGSTSTKVAVYHDERPLLVRFLAALGRLSVRLLPEYLLLVVALGALRGGTGS